MEVRAWAAMLLCVRSRDLATWACRSVYSVRVLEWSARWREEAGAVHGIAVAQYPWCATYDLAGEWGVGGPVIMDNGGGGARLVQGWTVGTGLRWGCRVGCVHSRACLRI